MISRIFMPTAVEVKPYVAEYDGWEWYGEMNG